MSVEVIFLNPDGSERVRVMAAEGSRLLDVAQGQNLPLEGACEGAMACATCHVLIASEEGALLKEPCAEEQDMLDFAYGVTATSRLACQIWLKAPLQRLTVRLPRHSRNMMGL